MDVRRGLREKGEGLLRVLCVHKGNFLPFLKCVCVSVRAHACMCTGEVVKVLFIHLGKELKRNSFTEPQQSPGLPPMAYFELEKLSCAHGDSWGSEGEEEQV